jgi:hypothetical protein
VPLTIARIRLAYGGGDRVQIVGCLDCSTDARSVCWCGQRAIGIIGPFRFRLSRRIAFDITVRNDPATRHQPGAWQLSAVKSDDRIAGNQTGRLGDEPLAATDAGPAATRGYRSARTAAGVRIAAVTADAPSRRIQRRQRAARVARPVAGRQRDQPERAWRRRQNPGGLHGLLGTGDPHDQAGMEKRLPAHDRPAQSLATHASRRLRGRLV